MSNYSAARTTFTRLVNETLDKWLGIATPDREWDAEADDLWQRLESAGYTITPTEMDSHE